MARPLPIDYREWRPISTAPFDRDIEIAYINYEGTHSLVFPCRRILDGWMKAETRERIEVRPSHWREYKKSLFCFSNRASFASSSASRRAINCRFVLSASLANSLRKCSILRRATVLSTAGSPNRHISPPALNICLFRPA